MRGSLDMSNSPPRALVSSVGLSGNDGRGHGSVLTAISNTLKRARVWRPVQLLTGGGFHAAGRSRTEVARNFTVDGSGGDGGGGDGGGRMQIGWRSPDLDGSPDRGVMSLVPRNTHEYRNGISKLGDRSTRGHNSSRKHGRSHRAVPVSTTRVQDGIKWVNLVRIANLTKLFRPCFLPRNRRRVRFNSPAAQRGKLMNTTGGEVSKMSGDLSATGGAASPGSPAAVSRPVYIQIRQGRHLVWPSFEGLDYSCFCLLHVGGQILGTTQAVPLAPGGGPAGASGGGGGAWGGISNTVQWNEGFSLPRSCFEGVLDGRVVLEVWSSESVGDDVLVGQAELFLGPMLEAEHPHPLATVLDLQAIDEDTGQLEPGTCGELHVAAWVEAEMVDTAAHRPYCLPSASPANLDEAGVMTSNLSAPCGSKFMPQVVHSTLGTLYEEPCVVALKISVVGLVDLSYDMLVNGAPPNGISRRRVRLEAHRSTGHLRDARSSRDAHNARDRERQSVHSSSGVKTSLSLGGGAPSHHVPFASPSVTRGMGLYLDRLRRKQQQQRILRQMQNPRSSPDKSGGTGGGAPAVSIAGSGGGIAAANTHMPFGCLPPLAVRFRRYIRRGGSGRAATGYGGSMDELIEDEEDAATLGGPGGGTASGGGFGAVEDKIGTGDDVDDGSSLTLNPTLPLSGMTSEDQTTGAGQGQGVFCYFKVSVDKQSHKSRLRWLPAQPQTPLGLSPEQQLQHLLDATSSVGLQPSVFVFTLVRPLSNVPVGLAMYVTTSARRRGRVVGRFTIQLYDLLDQVLGTTTGSGGSAAQRPDMGVTGRKVEIEQGFEETELGRVRLIVQVADLDGRASLFRLPLVSDPQQLVSEAALGPVAVGRCPVMTAAMMFGSRPSASGGGTSGGGKHGLGPVLTDKQLLRQVLKRSAVEPDVEDMFLASYARVGSLKAAGGGGEMQARVNSLRRIFPELSGGWRSGYNPAHGGLEKEATRIFKEALGAAGSSVGGAETTAGSFPAAASSVFANLLRYPDGFTGTDRGPTLEHSPGGSLAGRAEGDGSGGASTARRSCPPCILGSLVLRIASINTSGALTGNSYCCIVKCGPHWLRTVNLGSSQDSGGMPQWQVIIPLYNPATILTVGIFTSSAKSVMGLTFSDSLGLVSRVRLKLSSVRPFRRSWHIVAMYMNGASGIATSGTTPLVAVLGLKLQYNSLRTLAMSYLMPTAPESLYELDLEADMALRMEADARRISENWLASAQPPIPPEVARLLLDDGRMTFNFTRTKTNWRRVKAGMRLLLSLNEWFKHICSWKSLQDSLEVVFCIAMLCYLPNTACKLFFLMTALRGVRGFMQFRRGVAALVDGGAEAAASLLISPRGGTGSGTAVRSEAVAMVVAAGGGSTREQVGPMAGVTIGGGVVNADSDDEAGEDSKVPVGTVAEFKRKFAELIELGLLLQNLFDDVASILERMQAILSFQDVVASCLFTMGCVVAVGVVALLGFPTTVFLVLLWQVRPPALRDALPPPPFSYFMKLPCKSSAEFG